MECSTPEGIETVISLRTVLASAMQPVLNARRHRDGDQKRSEISDEEYPVPCSTPEGIETVIRRLSAALQAARSSSAQRPKASRR